MLDVWVDAVEAELGLGALSLDLDQQLDVARAGRTVMKLAREWGREDREAGPGIG